VPASFSGSSRLFHRARRLIPGGVNSPVRAFRAVGGDPLFIKSGRGPVITDVDGNSYIDYVGSWGPLLFGHALPRIVAAVARAAKRGTSFGAPTEAEVGMAEAITAMVPSVEVVRLVSSGTEATMSALRLARAATGREKVIKFEGCYHGHADAFLVKAGSGAMTLGTPDSAGVTRTVAADTVTCTYNDAAGVERALKRNRIAAVIVEPVVGNMGCVLPAPGFLKALRRLCTAAGTLLIFDEVMTGFRLAPGGAQQIFGVRPDITTLGKIIGGGLPVGAYGGRRKLMKLVAPDGPMYQAGTLSGNPLAVAAGLAMLGLIRTTPGVYEKLERLGERLESGMRENFARAGLPVTINRAGSMFTVFFNPGPVTDFASASRSDTRLFGRYFRGMLAEGVYLPPSQFEAAFVSAAHAPGHIDRTLRAQRRVLARL
jgi:glutamate-1-semialdehyde 2,1-aminomutase